MSGKRIHVCEECGRKFVCSSACNIEVEDEDCKCDKCQPSVLFNCDTRFVDGKEKVIFN